MYVNKAMDSIWLSCPRICFSLDEHTFRGKITISRPFSGSINAIELLIVWTITKFGVCNSQFCCVSGMVKFRPSAQSSSFGKKNFAAQAPVPWSWLKTSSSSTAPASAPTKKAPKLRFQLWLNPPWISLLFLRWNQMLRTKNVGIISRFVSISVERLQRPAF